MHPPSLPGSEKLPGSRNARASGSMYSSSLNRMSTSPVVQSTQQKHHYNAWNSSPSNTWNGRENHVFRPSKNDFTTPIASESASSVNDGVFSEHPPLPRSPRSKSTSKPLLWNSQVESSPEKKTKTNFAVKDMYNKFKASFRRNKTEESKHRPSSRSANKLKGEHAEKSQKHVAEDVVVRVLLLDGEDLSLQMSKRALGVDLVTRICDGQNIIEADYFGITFTDKKLGTWFWLDLDKKIIKQVPDTQNWQFYFQVKFYPPEPTMLQDETTRYQLVLQVRQDVYTGKLPCSWVTQALLGSFLVQSELGDYDPISQGPGIEYLRQFEFVRNPTDQLLQKIAELHKNHKGMKPAQADIKYLETAKRLDLYGLDLHPARDMENVEIYIGVGYSGIVVYRDRVRIGRFAWPKVLQISYKKNNFYLKIRPDYTEPEETVVGFLLLNPQLAKRLWKTAVEHHSFFRLKEPRASKRGPIDFLAGSSRFQYSGRTFFQYRTTQIGRPPAEERDNLRDDVRPRRQRTASVPAALNHAGITYNSLHSLNRTHPRDMTLGRAQSSDYLGPTLRPMRKENTQPQPSAAASPDSLLRPIAGARVPPKQPQPAAGRRNPKSPAAPVYLDNEGSLLDGTSSRGDGSLLGSGGRGADYEVPRQMSTNGYPSYNQEQGDLSMLIGSGVSNANGMGAAKGSSIAWSASNSYNPQPLQGAWTHQQETLSSSPSSAASSPYFPRRRDRQPRYANFDYVDAQDTSAATLKRNRRMEPYVRQDSLQGALP